MTEARRVVIESFGLPDVMRLETVTLPECGARQIQVRHTAIAFNFIDVYDREGRNSKNLPSPLGREAVGIVEKVGCDVTEFKVGDRVAYMDGGLGAYSDRRVLGIDRVVAVPDDLDDETVASLLMKGLTAQYLIKKTYRVAAGDLVLVHAAAGGVGQILCRWAKSLGATVVGAVSNEQKAEVAKAAGADFTVDYTKPDWPQAFLAVTGGRKADVVYDSVGKNTFLDSLECVAPLGMMVISGAASGPIPDFSPSRLKKLGGLFLTSPSVAFHYKTREALLEGVESLFEAIRAGIVKPAVGARYSLEQIVQMHSDAQARRLMGATIIVP
ncbi:MAG: quinone oxidoreductase [Burkholderiaceae bacterium]|nr:quinone oxidoreductase [Burkholderiaceae bacterium]